MNETLWALPCAHDLIRGNLSVDGAMFLEFFCGQAAITLSLLILNVPCIRPWDIPFGEQFNILIHGQVLQQLILARRIVAQHFAVPCQSLTWARSPQLRDAFHPEGLLSLSHFTGSSRLWTLATSSLLSQSSAVSCCIQWAAILL